MLAPTVSLHPGIGARFEARFEYGLGHGWNTWMLRALAMSRCRERRRYCLRGERESVGEGEGEGDREGVRERERERGRGRGRGRDEEMVSP